jgi:hypothetical protein
MQILSYFELIVYIYIVCNRVFTKLYDRTAYKASLLRCIFSRCTCFRDALAFADRQGGEKTDDYIRRFYHDHLISTPIENNTNNQSARLITTTALKIQTSYLLP